MRRYTITAVTFHAAHPAAVPGSGHIAGTVAIHREQRRTVTRARMRARQMREHGAAETCIAPGPIELPIGSIVSSIALTTPPVTTTPSWAVAIRLTTDARPIQCPACTGTEFTLNHNGWAVRSATIACSNCTTTLPTWPGIGPRPTRLHELADTLLHRAEEY